MNVIEMPNEEPVHQLNGAELYCISQMTAKCAEYKRKGRCKGNCKTCVWGDGKAAYDKLDEFQRCVVQTNAVRHYNPGIPTVAEACENIVSAMVYLFLIGGFVGGIALVVWIVKQVIR